MVAWEDDDFLMPSAGALLLLIDAINIAGIYFTTEYFSLVEQLK